MLGIRFEICALHQAKQGDFHTEAAQHIQYNTKASGMSILILPEIYRIFL